MANIQNNLQSIRQRIDNAALRCGRNPGEIRLVAVSKRIGLSAIEQANRAGQTIFGENYMQEAKEKIEQFQGTDAEWHFIGHIQSNKARDVAALIDMVHTVDRIKLAKALNRHAGEYNRKISVLVQVNVGEETQKAGILPGNAEGLVRSLRDFPQLEVKGLMTMPPFKSNPEEVRPYFRILRKLAEDFSAKGLFWDSNRFELSMGMSGDFEVAVEEGATLVRVGTAIFGERPALSV